MRAFGHGLRFPVDNTRAERDLRRLEVRQKRSGGRRTATGAAALARLRGSSSARPPRGVAAPMAPERDFAGAPRTPKPAGCGGTSASSLPLRRSVLPHAWVRPDAGGPPGAAPRAQTAGAAPRR